MFCTLLQRKLSKTLSHEIKLCSFQIKQSELCNQKRNEERENWIESQCQTIVGGKARRPVTQDTVTSHTLLKNRKQQTVPELQNHKPSHPL